MIKESVLNARNEAKRFIETTEKLLERMKDDNCSDICYGTKEGGACRRASMDLTRALAKMRKS